MLMPRLASFLFVYTMSMPVPGLSTIPSISTVSMVILRLSIFQATFVVLIAMPGLSILLFASAIYI